MMTSYCAIACIWAVQVCDRLKLFKYPVQLFIFARDKTADVIL